MKKIKYLFVFLIALLFMSVASCSIFVEVQEKIKLSDTKITLEVGESYTLNPELTGLGLDDLNVYAVNPQILNIEDFTITAVYPGKTDVIIESKKNGNVFTSVTVTVEGDVIILNPEIIINGDNEVMNGSTLQLSAQLIDLTGDVIWSSSNEDIATVDEKGLVTALKIGDVTITATVGDYSASKEIKVVEKKVTVVFKGLNGIVLDTQIITAGSNAVEPTAPIVEGMEFKGWDKEFTNVQDDLVVNAIYEAIPVFSVELDLDGGELEEEFDGTGYVNTEIILPTPSKTGYTFDGWVIEGETEFVTSIILDKNYKVIAKYTKIEVISDYLEVGEGKPYQTISEAIASAKAGDKILVQAGTYEEEISVDVSDIEILGINYELDPRNNEISELVIISGPLTLTANVENVTIKGFKFVNSNGVILAGNNKNITIENNIFDSSFASAATAANANGQIINKGEVQNLVVTHNSFYLRSSLNYTCNIALLYKVTDANVSENYFTNTAPTTANVFAVWLYNIAGYIQVNKNLFDRFAGDYWTVWLGNNATADGTIIDVIENVLDGRASDTCECGISVCQLTSETIYVNIIGNVFKYCKDTIIAIQGTGTSDTTSKPHVTIRFNKFESISGRMRFCVHDANFVFANNYKGDSIAYSDQGTPYIKSAQAAKDDFATEQELDIAYENFKNNEVTKYITITYELNGGSVSAATKLVQGVEYTLPIPKKEYATFLGWSLTPNSTEYITVIPATQEEDIVVYANWEEEKTYNVTYNFAGGYSQELFMTGVEDAPHLDINNYNYNEGAFWSNDNYRKYIFIGNNSNDPKATFSDRIYIGIDSETGLYKVVDFMASGASSWPASAQYVITISNSYNNYYATIQPITKKIEVGMYACFDGDFTTADVDHPVTVGFFNQAPTATSITLKVTSNGQLIVPGYLGFKFLGWYDENDKLYSSVNDLTGDVTLTAKWEELTPVTSIVVDELQSEMLEGDVQQIIAHVEPLDAYFKQILYSSTDTNVLTVDENGLVKAINTGKAKIIMTNYMKNITVEREIEVFAQNTIDVRCTDQFKGVLEAGEELQLNISLFGKDAATATYTVTSSDPGVIGCDNDGKLTAQRDGQATITIASSELGVSLQIPMVVMTFGEELSEIDKIFKLIVDEHINLLEVGNACLYNDGNEKVFRSTYGSVNRFLFDEFLVHTDYYQTSENNPNNHKNRRSTDQIEFVCVHDTATLTGTVVSIASGMSSGETSIHYTVGNDAIYGVVPEKYIAYHAGDGTGTTFYWVKTNAPATANVKPEFDIVDVSGVRYVTVNGIRTSVSAPDVNGQPATKETFTYLGPVWKVEDGFYYIGAPLWSKLGQTPSYGGNNNSIGIEMCVNLSGDIYDTWQRTAQLVADILLRNQLDPTRVYMHNTFMGKNCPQCLLEGNYWYAFMEMVEVQYAIQKDYKDAVISINSHNPEILDNTGRIIKAPLVTTVVSYDLTIEYNNETRQITLSTVVPGATCWEEWNGTYSASTIWNQKHFVRP